MNLHTEITTLPNVYVYKVSQKPVLAAMPQSGNRKG